MCVSIKCMQISIQEISIQDSDRNTHREKDWRIAIESKKNIKTGLKLSNLTSLVIKR